MQASRGYVIVVVFVSVFLAVGVDLKSSKLGISFIIIK